MAAPMATMMLGETDDSFEAVDTDLQNLSLAITASANNLSNQLYSAAEWNKNIIILVTLAGFLISTFVVVLVGQSIVRPIELITDVMQRLSAGEVDVQIGHRDRRDEIGHMVGAIDVFRKNIIDRHAMEQTLTEAIEAISEGFSLYDDQDRIVACNTRYREMFSYDLKDVVGSSFESIMSNAVTMGLITEAQGDPRGWVAKRLAKHRIPVPLTCSTGQMGDGSASASAKPRTVGSWRPTLISANSNSVRRNWRAQSKSCARSAKSRRRSI